MTHDRCRDLIGTLDALTQCQHQRISSKCRNKVSVDAGTNTIHQPRHRRPRRKAGQQPKAPGIGTQDAITFRPETKHRVRPRGHQTDRPMQRPHTNRPARTSVREPAHQLLSSAQRKAPPLLLGGLSQGWGFGPIY